MKVRILETRAYLIDRDKVKVNFSVEYQGERRSFRALMRQEDVRFSVSTNDELTVSHLIISEDKVEDRPIGIAVMIYSDLDPSPFERGVCFSSIPKKFADLDWSEVPEYIVYDGPKYDPSISIETMQRISEHGIMLPDNFVAFSEEDAVLAKLIA